MSIPDQAYALKGIMEAMGMDGVKMFRFTPIDENQWECESESGKTYTITHVGKKLHCTCPVHMFKHKDCKHVDMFSKSSFYKI